MKEKLNTPQDRVELLAELTDAGIKHSPEKVLFIARRADGKIVFLETGWVGDLCAETNEYRNGRGLVHILQKHKQNFTSKYGITEDKIPHFVFKAATVCRLS